MARSVGIMGMHDPGAHNERNDNTGEFVAGWFGNKEHEAGLIRAEAGLWKRGQEWRGCRVVCAVEGALNGW